MKKLKKYSIENSNPGKHKDYIDMYDDILSRKKDLKQMYLLLHFKWENSVDYNIKIGNSRNYYFVFWSFSLKILQAWSSFRNIIPWL